ncbi:hypothetical protein TNCV_922841 [Trichonephila clavipes]|nr:hypothetical protein TNCV_922841 [Trichonephila clavipes]
MSHLAFFAHVFHHGGQLYTHRIANIPEEDQTLFASRWTTRTSLMTPAGPTGQRKIFEKLGLFTINLEMLPFPGTLPDHLHDEVHEDISECIMAHRFARYLQHFNKLQAECKKQTAHLVEQQILPISTILLLINELFKRSSFAQIHKIAIVYEDRYVCLQAQHYRTRLKTRQLSSKLRRRKGIKYHDELLVKAQHESYLYSRQSSVPGVISHNSFKVRFWIARIHRTAAMRLYCSPRCPDSVKRFPTDTSLISRTRFQEQYHVKDTDSRAVANLKDISTEVIY